MLYFQNSKIGKISRYSAAGQEVHHKPAGSVMVVEFAIEGQTFTALNGGPNFKFNEAISLQVRCETQAEVDYFWEKLTQGGEEGPCGWLKDKFGLSWQVVPAAIPKMMTDPDSEKSERVMNAFLKMKKLDIAATNAPMRGVHNERHRQDRALRRSDGYPHARSTRRARWCGRPGPIRK